MSETKALLELRGLHIGYETARGVARAMRGIDLRAPAGAIVGVVGESGCGKSTLLGAILRILPENARVFGGSIEFGGRDLLALSEEEMRNLRGSEISAVFQNPMESHNPTMTIGRQMIDIQYRARLPDREKRARAAASLETVGIPDPARSLDLFPHQMSGGMRQRAAIAMALMARPRLLVADEPTTALDATLEAQIIELLKNLQREIGCAILFVSHHLGAVAELCEFVAVMYAGQIVESGRAEDVFGRPAHPYTRKLLECDPARIAKTTRLLPTIAGGIPDLTSEISGCAFCPRCSQAIEKCRVESPPSFAVGDGHFASCHLLAT